VHGSGGLLRAHNQHATTVEKATADGFASDPALHFFLERYAAAYRAEMDTFVTGVTEGKPLAPTGEDGLKALILADAAEESAKSGKSIHLK
jgi:myo-inositol 2-dehydrogenase / D-chiro-inositol 1-dehydrogenase